MPAKSNYGTGRYQAARSDLLWLPKGYRRDGTLRGVVYLHGAGELAASPLNYAPGGKQAEASLLYSIAELYPTISFDCGTFGSNDLFDSNHFGSLNAQSELTNAIAWLQTAGGAGGSGGGGAKAGKVLLVGISMGHAISMTWGQAGTNASKIGCIVGILPVNDLDDIRDNNRGGYRAVISTDWGVGAWVSPGNPALPAGANPALVANQTKLRTIPQRLYAASDDTICTFASSVALQANLGSICTLVNLGAGDHTDASVGHVSIPDVLAFLAANS